MKLKSTDWLLLNPSVFVDFISDSFVFMYDTKSATYMTSTDPKFINTIHQIFHPESNGSIKFDDSFDSQDLEIAQSRDFLFIVKSSYKPVNLLPILNLQFDLLRGDSIKNRISLINSKLSLLSGLKIELASMISDCISNPVLNKRKSALTQYCIYSDVNNEIVKIDNLLRMLERIAITSVATIDLYCNKYSFQNRYSIEKILSTIPSYIKINIHITIEDYYAVYMMIDSVIQGKDSHIKLYADQYTPKELIIRGIEANDEIYYFLYSEQSLDAIEDYNDKINLCPVVLDDNIEWIKSIFAIESKSIVSTANTFNHIFRNMKLNANFFGILDINGNGDVSAHGSMKNLANIYDEEFSLVDSVVKALKNDDAWRYTRNMYPSCSLCSFRYLCPPISMFESRGLIDTICINKV